MTTSVTETAANVTEQRDKKRDSLARARPPYGGMSRLSRVTHQPVTVTDERDSSSVTGDSPDGSPAENVSCGTPDGGANNPQLVDLAHARAFAEVERHRCEVRHLLTMRCINGSAWLRNWLQDNKVQARREALERDIRVQWAAGNRGEEGDWR